MNRPRAPYAKRTVWNAVVILAVIIVIGGGIAGYEINHLQREVNSLHAQVTTLYQGVLQQAGKSK
jgi:hypothetical protein